MDGFAGPFSLYVGGITTKEGNTAAFFDHTAPVYFYTYNTGWGGIKNLCNFTPEYYNGICFLPGFLYIFKSMQRSGKDLSKNIDHQFYILFYRDHFLFHTLGSYFLDKPGADQRSKRFPAFQIIFL